MGNVFDIALMFSPHEWVEEFHRYCTNTGTLRIRSLIYDSSVLQTEHFDAFIISDTHPSLSLGLVKQLHDSNRIVIGVCDDEADARKFLSELDVDGIFSSRISAKDLSSQIQEFLASFESKPDTSTFGIELANELDEVSNDNFSHSRDSKVVSFIGSGGTGCTEISLLAASRLIDSLIIDLDFEHPSIAPRTGLDVEPHIIGALESVNNYSENLSQFTQRLKTTAAIVGISHSSFATDVIPFELQLLTKELKQIYSNVVFDLGNVSATSGFADCQASIIELSDQIVVIGEPTPVGVLRILEKIAYLSTSFENQQTNKIIVVLNKCPKNSHSIFEVIRDLQNVEQISEVIQLPYVNDIFRHSWDTQIAQPRSWKKQFNRLVECLNEHRVVSLPTKTIGDLSSDPEKELQVAK